MNPKTVAKAVRMAVVERRDGSYHVSGDTATRTVRITTSLSGDRVYWCDCPAAQSRSQCSHILSVRFHIIKPVRSHSASPTAPVHSLENP